MSYSVKVEGFSYCYPDGTLALQNINLAIKEGQKVALIGPSGAGKSTLLRAMAGFIRGTGRIEINGLELASQNLRQIRSQMGCYMGNPNDYLSMPTVYEDIIFGPLSQNMDFKAVRQNVDYILEKMELTALVKKSSHSLSDGQKRAAAIASLLSLSPRIFLMDEPCIGLNSHSLGNLVEVFGGLGQSFVFSTCVMRFAAEMADRVIMLYNGQVIADGAASEILHDEKLLVVHGLDC